MSTLAAIGSNGRALIWGNDGTATGSWVATDAPTGYERITREWQFQEKNGNIGNVKIAYPATSVPAGFTGTLMMLVDTDSAFAAGATAYTGTLNAGNWEFTVDMADMAYMTFAKSVPTDTTPPVISGSGPSHSPITIVIRDPRSLQQLRQDRSILGIAELSHTTQSLSHDT